MRLRTTWEAVRAYVRIDNVNKSAAGWAGVDSNSAKADDVTLRDVNSSSPSAAQSSVIRTGCLRSQTNVHVVSFGQQHGGCLILRPPVVTPFASIVTYTR